MGEKSQVRTWIDAIGLIGVIASLVFVGLEIRQGTVATRSATQQAIFEAGRTQILAEQSNPALLQLIVASEADPSIADSVDGTVAGRMLRSHHRNRFNAWENNYYQYRRRTLDEGMWSGWESFIRAEIRSPIVERYWTGMREDFSPEFRELMSELGGEGFR